MNACVVVAIIVVGGVARNINSFVALSHHKRSKVKKTTFNRATLENLLPWLIWLFSIKRIRPATIFVFFFLHFLFYSIEKIFFLLTTGRESNPQDHCPNQSLLAFSFLVIDESSFCKSTN